MGLALETAPYQPSAPKLITKGDRMVRRMEAHKWDMKVEAGTQGFDIRANDIAVCIEISLHRSLEPGMK